MSVYVDPNMAWPKVKNWSYGFVSHMYADSKKELHAMAKRLGLKREWCSDHTQPDASLLHYDLSPGMRAKAVKLGAMEVDHKHGRPYMMRRAWWWKEFKRLMKQHEGVKVTAKTFEVWQKQAYWFCNGIRATNAQTTKNKGK